MNKIITSSIAALALVASANANIFNYDLIGVGGPGLLTANEPVAPLGGASGGEIGLGIFLDDLGDLDINTNLLTVNVGWGSSQGFSDLSSAAINQHIHGPTLAVNGNNGSGDFRQTASVAIQLNRSSSAVTGGVFTDAPISLNATQVTQLNEGRFYINIHTVNNSGGELRGFIVPAAPVPEPASIGLLAVGAMALIRRRNR